MQILVILIICLYIFFIPGFFLSLIFFKWRKLDLIERLTFSFALSIAVVPLVVFFGNLFGIPLTAITVVLQATGILAVTGIILLIQQRKETT